MEPSPHTQERKLKFESWRLVWGLGCSKPSKVMGVKKTSSEWRRTGSFPALMPSPSHQFLPTLPVCRISCLWSLPDTYPCSAFFSLLSLLLKAIPCNILSFHLSARKFPMLSSLGCSPSKRRNTLSVHPAWSCSQLGRGWGWSHSSWGRVQSLSMLPLNPLGLYCSSQEPQAEHLESENSEGEQTALAAGTVPNATAALLLMTSSKDTG